MSEEIKGICTEDSSKEIVIDLNRSKYPNISHKHTELIQQEAISKLCQHMERVKDEYKDSKTRYRPEYKEFKDIEGDKFGLDEYKFMEYAHFRRRHEAVALIGERGTGKSSFLVNLKDILGTEHYEYLKILDPTLFEDRQNILVAIISMIKDIVFKDKDIKDYEKREDKIFEKWKITLQKLSEGLNLIDEGIGSNPMQKDMWDDARLVMQKGLKASKSGYGFERQFHVFISYTLQLINKEALILRLDDIDTNPEKGWNVLEVIRKYLTTPHLQIIISGDWKLYSKMVRLRQWQNLKELIKLDKDYRGQKESVDDLEEQYLTKILQPEYRIYLRTLRHIDEDKKSKILVKSIDSDNQTNIELYMNEKNTAPTVKNIYIEIFENIFNLSDNLKDNACAMMMTLPLRTNLQTLRAFEESIATKDKNCTIDKVQFLEEFTNVFLTLINRFDFSFRDFRKLFEPSGYNFLANKIYALIEKHDELSFAEVTTPRVVLEDDSANLFLLFIYGFVTQSMNKNPALIFDWYYRVQMLSKLFEVYDEDTFLFARKYLDHKKRVSTYKVAIKYSGLLIQNNNESSDDSVRNELDGFAYLYSFERQNPNKEPYMALDKFEANINKGQYTENTENKLFIKLLLSIVTKGVVNKRGKERQVLTSAHYLFGFLSNILNNSDVASLPSIMSYMNTLKEFDDGKNTDSRISYGEHIYDREDLDRWLRDTETSLGKFVSKLEDWKKYLYDDAIKDFSLSQIDDTWSEYDTKEAFIEYAINMGDYLELQVYIFLNALLQASLEKKGIATLFTIKDVKGARQRFILNVKKYYFVLYEKKFGDTVDNLKEILAHVRSNYEKGKKIDIFEFFLLCPVWDYFINFEHIGLIDEETKEPGLFDEVPKSQADEEYYSSILKRIAVRTIDDVINKAHKGYQARNKTPREIIEDRFEELDEDNLPGHGNSMYKLIQSTGKYKQVNKNRIEEWIKIYNEVKKEREA